MYCTQLSIASKRLSSCSQAALSYTGMDLTSVAGRFGVQWPAGPSRPLYAIAAASTQFARSDQLQARAVAIACAYTSFAGPGCQGCQASVEHRRWQAEVHHHPAAAQEP